MIITFDGPVASGKSTIARSIAQEYNFFYLYSGLLYRAFAYVLHRKEQLPLSQEQVISEKVAMLHFVYGNDERKNPLIWYEGEDITEALFAESVALLASEISGYERVRTIIGALQQSLAITHKNIIVDGRDGGIRIFPHATVKFFITASESARRNRILGRGGEEAMHSMALRDKRDIIRKIDPMKPAKDSIVLDTSFQTKEEIIAYIKKIITTNTD